MTEAERFDVVLEELGSLVDRLGWYCDDVVLIGGQVLAVEQVAAGEDPVLQVQTDTGQTIERGFSFDPDLLVRPIDPEQSARGWDELPQLLRDAGYRRVREHQWEKLAGEVAIRVDLFIPDDARDAPTGMTPLPRGGRVLSRARRLRLPVGDRRVDLQVPSIVDFVLMKLDAPRLRATATPKDAFDLYAYVRKKGPAEVGLALAGAQERDEALSGLQRLFGDEESPGVADVLSYAPTLEGDERRLVVRDVVAVFADVRRAALGSTPVLK